MYTMTSAKIPYNSLHIYFSNFIYYSFFIPNDTRELKILRRGQPQERDFLNAKKRVRVNQGHFVGKTE